MEFKSKKIVVEQDTPFANDKLARKASVNNVSVLLQNFSSPIVMAINAPWGQGKTTFLEMLNADLKNNECKSIYFSAWETDFVSDPLLAFLGEMNSEISSIVNGDEKKQEVWETTKKVGKHILRKGIPALIKIGTAGVIDAEKIIEDEASKLMEGLSKDYIDEYSKNKSAIKQFKTGISSILNNKNKPLTKLYIFIDELDRCRPTYAIEFLERIKHLLDIEGLIFVLALDKIQLSHSIKGIYGAEFESIGYLRRFIDIEYNLPTCDLGDFIDQQYINFDFHHFFQKRRAYSAFQYEKDQLKSVFKLLAVASNLTLREVEQLFAKINLAIHSTAVDTHLYPVLLATLIIIKDKNPSVYQRYLMDETTPVEIIELLYNMISESVRFDLNECALIEGYLIGAKLHDYENRLGMSFDVHKNHANNPNGDPKQKQYSERVMRIASSFKGYSSGINLQSLKERIEMTECFTFSSESS